MTAAVLTFPDTGSARLRRALAGLDAAIAAQGVAVAEWRASLGALKATTDKLGDSWRGYDVSLDRLAGRVRTLNVTARRLEAWADDTLAREEPKHGG